MNNVITLLCVAFWVNQAYAADQFTCYSCSYVMSSDPSVGYECVTKPWNVTRGSVTMPCTVPNMCATKTTFSTGMYKIRSVTRSCLPPQEHCSGEKCCNKDGVYTTCEHKCRTDICNKQSPEHWLKMPSSNTGGGTKNTGSGANFVHGISLPFVVVSLIINKVVV